MATITLNRFAINIMRSTGNCADQDATSRNAGEFLRSPNRFRRVITRVPYHAKTAVQRQSLSRRTECLVSLPDLMAHVLHWLSILKHKCSLGFVSRPFVRECGLHNGVIRGRFAQIQRRPRRGMRGQNSKQNETN